MNSDLLNRIRDAWSTLSARERQLVTYGGSLVAVIALWLVVVMPIDREAKRLRLVTPEAQAQLIRMRAQAAAIQPLRGKARSIPGPGAAVAVVDQSATSLGIRKQISKLEGDGSQGVQIVADAVAFNSLIAWINDLRDAHGFRVESADFTAHTIPGTVNARIRIRGENQ